MATTPIFKTPSFTDVRIVSWEEREKERKQKELAMDFSESSPLIFDDHPVYNSDTPLKDEEKRDVSAFKTFGAGIVSGLIKIPEGFVNLPAILSDSLGMSHDASAKVEKYFDDSFLWGLGGQMEEIAEQNMTGRIMESFTSLAGFGTAGIRGLNFLLKAPKNAAKISAATKDAWKNGKYFSAVHNSGKWAANNAFIRGSAGFGLGQAFSPDAEELSFFGDDEVRDTATKEAQRNLKNQAIFALESMGLSLGIGGLFKGIHSTVRRFDRGAMEQDVFMKDTQSVLKKLLSRSGDKSLKAFDLRRENVTAARRWVDENVEQIMNALDKQSRKLYPLFQEIGNKSIGPERVNFQKLLAETWRSGKTSSKKFQKKLNKIIEIAKSKGLEARNRTLLKKSIIETRNIVDTQLEKGLGLRTGWKRTKLTDVEKNTVAKLKGYIENLSKAEKKALKAKDNRAVIPGTPLKRKRTLAYIKKRKTFYRNKLKLFQTFF